MEIKFGLKLWSTNSDMLKEAKELIKNEIFHYIELMPIPGTEVTPFLDDDLPYVIHITTERHGVNIAYKKKDELNLRTISTCIEWADKLNAKYIILHPGFGLIDNAIGFLEKIEDRRIVIENMPKVGLNDESMIGYTPEQIKELMGKRFGLCLDLNHAIKAAVSLRRPYKEFIEDFLKLKPNMFHISDGNRDNEKDKHLNIGEGDYDFEFLIRSANINNPAYITLETPRLNQETLVEDVMNITALKKMTKTTSI